MADPTDDLFDPAEASPPSAPLSPQQGTGEPRETGAPQAAQGRNPDGTFGHKHPAYLVEDARELFFSDAEIAAAPSDELARLVRLARAKQRQLERDFRQQQVLESSRQPAAPPAPVAPKPPTEEEELDRDLPSLDHLDDSVAATIRLAWRKAARAERENAQLKQHAIQQQNQSIGERLDDAFASLPAEYHDLLGEGDLATCTDQQKKRRNFLLDEAGLNVYQLPSPRELKGKLLKTAQGILKVKEAAPPVADTGGYGKTPDGKDLPNGPTTKEWLNGGSHRPTARNGGQELPSESKAISNLRARMQERGLLPEQQTRAEILDGIPD